jgi:hypothetical protein
MITTLGMLTIGSLIGWLASQTQFPIAVQAQEKAGSELRRFEHLANSPFAEDRPTAETAQLLKDELRFQRASQVYLWALPVINLYGMREGSEAKFGAGYNVLPVFKKRLDAKTLITTA